MANARIPIRSCEQKLRNTTETDQKMLALLIELTERREQCLFMYRHSHHPEVRMQAVANLIELERIEVVPARVTVEELSR